MSEMIERVADAIAAADGQGEYAAARAAIEAMREPTQEMIAAVNTAEEQGGYCFAAYEHIDWDRAWPVAIDAALNSGKPRTAHGNNAEQV